jgi:glycerol uptake facilitator-like aquaporin
MPLVVLTVFMFLSLGLSFATAALDLWFEPVGGFILAGAWVLTAYLMVPDHKGIASLLAFTVGAMLACKLIGRSWWPEGYAKAYHSTYIPLISTLTGGIMATTLALWNEERGN